MAFPTLATEAAKARRILTKRFGRKERALLASVDAAIDAALPVEDGSITAAKLASDAVESAKIKDANVTKAKLEAALQPSHVVKYAGKHTTVGNATSEDVTVTGALATDIVMVTIQANSGTTKLLTAAPDTDKVTLTFDNDPSTEITVAYVVLRAT